jgi:hypothetical protein
MPFIVLPGVRSVRLDTECYAMFRWGAVVRCSGDSRQTGTPKRLTGDLFVSKVLITVQGEAETDAGPAAALTIRAEVTSGSAVITEVTATWSGPAVTATPAPPLIDVPGLIAALVPGVTSVSTGPSSDPVASIPPAATATVAAEPAAGEPAAPSASSSSEPGEPSAQESAAEPAAAPVAAATEPGDQEKSPSTATESTTTKVTPAKRRPAKNPATKSTTAKSTAAKSNPAKSTATKRATAKATPAKSTAAAATSEKPAPVKSVPAKSTAAATAETVPAVAPPKTLARKVGATKAGATVVKPIDPASSAAVPAVTFSAPGQPDPPAAAAPGRRRSSRTGATGKSRSGGQAPADKAEGASRPYRKSPAEDVLRAQFIKGGYEEVMRENDAPMHTARRWVRNLPGGVPEREAATVKS